MQRKKRNQTVDKRHKMDIFSLAFFGVVFLGGSANCEFLKMTDCDREQVYCYRQNFFALCLDAEKLHVFWKFNVQCFLGTNCEQDNFPCGLPLSSVADLLAFVQTEYLTKTNVTTTDTANITNTVTEVTETSTVTTGTSNSTPTTNTAVSDITSSTTPITNTTQTENSSDTTTPTSSTETSDVTNSTTNGTSPITTPTETESTETETEPTTTPGTTTTVGPPDCTSTGTSKGSNCQQYYECIGVWWWYEPRLRTCPSGQSYNATANGCTADPTCIVQA